MLALTTREGRLFVDILPPSFPFLPLYRIHLDKSPFRMATVQKSTDPNCKKLDSIVKYCTDHTIKLHPLQKELQEHTLKDVDDVGLSWSGPSPFFELSLPGIDYRKAFYQTYPGKEDSGCWDLHRGFCPGLGAGHPGISPGIFTFQIEKRYSNPDIYIWYGYVDV